MIPPDLRALVDSGASLLVATRDAELFPEAVRAMGVRLLEEGREVEVCVPHATGARTAANARTTGRVAVCFSRVRDHKTFQVKGRCVEVRDATEADRPWIERWRAGFTDNLAFVGMAPRVTLRIAFWPAHVLRVRVDAVFIQTPGPGAGEPLPAGGPA